MKDLKKNSFRVEEILPATDLLAEELSQIKGGIGRDDVPTPGCGNGNGCSGGNGTAMLRAF